MRSVLIIILLAISLTCEGQKKVQPPFIKFEEQVAHPELELSNYPPLYISTIELDLPLPPQMAKIVQESQKSKPTKSAKGIDTVKEFYLSMYYWREITDKKTFDVLHDYILRSAHLLLSTKHRPDCLIAVDNKRYYLPQKNMKKFYRDLMKEFSLKKCDMHILDKIAAQFTTGV